MGTFLREIILDGNVPNKAGFATVLACITAIAFDIGSFDDNGTATVANLEMTMLALISIYTDPALDHVQVEDRFRPSVLHLLETWSEDPLFLGYFYCHHLQNPPDGEAVQTKPYPINPHSFSVC